jgi:hypothetical protein
MVHQDCRQQAISFTTGLPANRGNHQPLRKFQKLNFSKELLPPISSPMTATLKSQQHFKNF